jgi:hypothetical protein
MLSSNYQCGNGERSKEKEKGEKINIQETEEENLIKP